MGYYRNDGVPAGQPQIHKPGGQLPASVVTASLPRILICPSCAKPTFFEGGVQVPGVAYGKPVQHLPSDLDEIYTEARNCMAVNAYISAVLTARTILMHIAVEEATNEHNRFKARGAELDAAIAAREMAEADHAASQALWLERIANVRAEALEEAARLMESDGVPGMMAERFADERAARIRDLAKEKQE